MNIRKKFVKFILLFALSFICLSIFNLSFAKDDGALSQNLAYKTVTDYCNLEFQHDFNRDKLMKMSESYQDRIDKLTGSIETLYIPNVYELFAVKSYKIINVKIDGNKAVATVGYDVLAKRTGWKTVKYMDGTTGEAVFTEFRKPDYIEKINLIFDGKGWFVIDPPSPKISIDKVMSFLESNMLFLEKHHPEVKNGTSKPGFQRSYEENKRNLTLLKTLAGD